MVKIGINSHIDFYKKTVHIALKYYAQADIENDLIHVFIGGCTKESYENINGVHYYFVTHNSLDFTAMVEIVEKEIESEYWFLIHDTAIVGGRFKELLYNFPTGAEKVALLPHPSMNIGLYSYKYLLRIKDIILVAKNTDYSNEAVQKFKKFNVEQEDYILFETLPEPATYGPKEWYIKSYENWYGGDSIRRIEYYPNLDIYKSKSNWLRADEYNTKL
jgi:hypothetical protein